MQVVVADASPLIVLVNLGRADLLRDVWGGIVIPPAVAAELARPNRPAAVRAFIASPPAWLQIRPPAVTTPLPSLHGGETAAIHLAEELAPTLLLIDEREGRAVAAARGIPIMGTVGFLELAATQGRVDLKVAFDAIKRSDFHYPHAKLDTILADFLARQPLP